MDPITRKIADELAVAPQQITAAIQLLDDGATVPFIARYRKEATGSLDDTQLRTLEDRLRYLRDLEDRRTQILTSIQEQNQLTPELAQAIKTADSKARLEDLYLPYKPKRRTKAQIAREAGLEPLATALMQTPSLEPDVEAAQYINPDNGIPDTKSALDDAKQILMEQFAEDAELIAKLRTYLQAHGMVKTTVLEDKKQAGDKFRDYFDYAEQLNRIPSHRALAIFRGRNEGILSASIDIAIHETEKPVSHPCETIISQHTDIAAHTGKPAAPWLEEVVRWTWRVKLKNHLETEFFTQLREQAEEEAIQVFARNLKELLLAAPAGPHTIMGLDPGLRTGVKVAVIDSTGQLTTHATIFPHAPKKQWEAALTELKNICEREHVSLIGIGNGTASRETDKLVGELIKQVPELKLQKIVVSEAGASVYSASEYAAREFPDLDVSFRGAVSIARRLQDPLAELVKIDPKAIGVGQYQHDVNQIHLARSLDAVVEDCVNQVGVDLNTASIPLLSRISGLNPVTAANIVQFRDEHGSFKSREILKKVTRLGPKTYEQCAGFLRIPEGANPLDASSVHPEAYPLVEKIAADHNRPINALIGDSGFLKNLDPKHYIQAQFGLPTVIDIIKELDKPGRDPRPEFRTAKFQDGIEKMTDLQPGMVLEGVVSNVTNFGAFVDIGVHQDGLVHISALADRFVKNPHDVVKPGDIVKVKVLELEPERKRIALTMRLTEPQEKHTAKPKRKKADSGASHPPKAKQHPTKPKAAPGNNAFALAFAEAKKKP
ncbi:MAG: RNA-binding transcriptional accessory protein [Gammaproteobacteria bacterium]|nr:RNA-binding transcriptional accessory protein [Gammaproteobacteria bacterium]